MALTRLDHTGDGTTTVYNVAFSLGYLQEADIYVSLDSGDYTTQLSYSFLNATQIVLDTPVSSGVAFNIRRVVDRNQPINDYQEGAILRENNLDDSFIQSLMILQEITDGYLVPIGDVLLNSDLDMVGNHINNVATAVEQHQAMPKSQADALYYTLTGDTLTGDMNTDGNTVTGLPDAVSASDALPLSQGSSLFYSLVGDTLQGVMNTAGYKITGLPTATNPTDAIGYQQVINLITATNIQGAIPQVNPRQLGDGTTTTFNTPAVSTQQASSFFVNLDGVSQRPLSDFSIDTSGNCVFVEAPALNVDIDITFFEPVTSFTIFDTAQPYIFPTVASYEASTIVFPIGKTIHLNDRDADFVVISGVGTANTANIIASISISQSIELEGDQFLSTQWGTVGDGLTDDSVVMTQLDLAASNNKVTIIGTVLFTSSNLVNTANYIFEEGASIVDIRGQQIVMVDADGETVVGLQHNHLLEDDTTLGSNLAQTSGNINPAPKAIPFRAGSVDVMAYWYQDFGLDYTRQGNGANGGLTWYYWGWNFATNTGDGVTTTAYNPDRRPLLGYYRGDDNNVMDWQCYWLASYGCTGTIVQPRANFSVTGWSTLTTTWSQSTDVNYWMYKLFNEVPNFTALQYQLWGYTDFLADTVPNRQIYIDSWTDIINNIYLKYSNFHYIKKGSKIYPVLFLFEANAIRTTFGNNADNKEAQDFMISMSNLFIAAGYGGIALMCRNPTSTFVGNPYLEANNVLYYDAEYSAIESAGDITNYKDYAVDGLDFSVTDKIRGINNTVTSRDSVYPHPSSFASVGNTPDLFRQAVTKGINQISASDAPNILSIYNVSEWAEGGAGLQPNVQDGFDYMEALADGIRGGKQEQTKKMRAIRVFWKPVSAGSQRVQNLSATWADTIEIFTDFSTDEVSAAPRLPNIYNGFDGARVQLRCVGSHTFRLVDEAVTAGTNIKLAQLGGAGSKLLLAPNQTADFIFDGDLDLWVCTGTTGTPV